MLSKLNELQIGSGPVKGGLFNNDGTAFTGPNPLLNSNFDATTLYEGGRRPPSFFNTLGTVGGQQMIPEQGPLGPGLIGGIPPARNPGSPGGVQVPNVTGTQMPIGGTPISPSTNTGIDSLFKNREFNTFLNSYVDNAINTRMRDIFGGIMSIFQ